MRTEGRQTRPLKRVRADSDEEAAAFQVQDCAGRVVGFAEEDYGAGYVLGRAHLLCQGALDQPRYLGVVVVLGRHHHAQRYAVDLDFGGQFLGQRLEVDVEVRVPVALGDLFERSRCEDRGGVDEDVDAAEGVEHGGNHLLDFDDVLEVRVEGLCLTALACDFGDDRVRLGSRRAVVNCDSCAVRGKAPCDCASDAAACAGYECYFSFEFHRELRNLTTNPCPSGKLIEKTRSALERGVDG